MNAEVPLINGVSYSWADITVLAGGVLLMGITSVEYDDKQDVVNNYGAGRYPVSRGKGRITSSAKITIDMHEVLSLQAQSHTGRLQDLQPFSLQVSYIPDGATGMIVHDVIHNCQFATNSRKWKEGDTNQLVDLDLIPSHITWGRKG